MRFTIHVYDKYIYYVPRTMGQPCLVAFTAGTLTNRAAALQLTSRARVAGSGLPGYRGIAGSPLP